LFSFGPHDVWTLFHSFTFDFSVWEIWGVLLYGGRLVVVPILSAGTDGLALIRARRHHLNQTPSAFITTAGGPGASCPRTKAPIVVRDLGGEALNSKAEDWYERHGESTTTLVNMYGITETTVHVSHIPLENPSAMLAVRRARPLRRSVYVLDGRWSPSLLG
jgi:nonribosomal peptide synthetase DhbF